MRIKNNGIESTLSGIAGSLVAASWKGIPYLRKRPTVRHPSKSPALKSNRGRFAVAFRFVQSMPDLVKITFCNEEAKMTAFNSAVSYTLTHAVAGEYPNLFIDYAMVLISRGDLPNAAQPIAMSNIPETIAFSWTNNSGTGLAKAGDIAVLVACCEATNACIYTTMGATRKSGTATLQVPNWGGTQVHTYIAFISKDGTAISDSIYTGLLSVTE